MISRFKLFVFTCFSAIVLAKCQNDCEINVRDVAGRKHVLVSVAPNEDLSLLTTEFVAHGSKILLACSSADSQEITCQNQDKFSEDLRKAVPCEKYLSFAAKNLTENCGLNGRGQYQQIGFQVKYKNREQFLELYRICYKPNSNSRPLFTRHRVHKFDISMLPANERSKDGFGTPPAVASKYDKYAVYDRVERILGSNYYFQYDEMVIAPGHLTPAIDFPFRHQMEATFYGLNIVPIFQKIKIMGDWMMIENWIRRTARRVGSVEVVSGGYGVLELAIYPGATYGKKLILDNGKLPVPEWLYKIVKYENESHVLVVYNNPYSEVTPTKICKRTRKCPAFSPAPFTPSLSKGYLYCCDVDEFKGIVGLP